MKHPFNSDQGLVVVPIQVFGSHSSAIINMALDTGAISTHISKEILIDLGYDLDNPLNTHEITTGNGKISLSTHKILFLKGLGIEKTNYTVMAHNLETPIIQGVLGLTFFRDKQLNINFKDGFVEIL